MIKTILKILKEIRISLFIAIVLATLIVYGTHVIMGQLHTASRDKQLLETVLQTSRYLNSAAVGSSATVLALVLNFIGMSQSSTKNLSNAFYRQLQGLSIFATASLVIGIVLLQATTLPIISADGVSYNYLPYFYWSFMIIETILVALLMTIVFVLLQSIWTVISKAKKGQL